MSDFLDTIAGFGKTLKDAAVDGVKTTAAITVQAAADVLRNPMDTGKVANGTIKQPAKGVSENGTPVVVLPDDTKVNQAGQIVVPPTASNLPPAVLYGGGALLVLVALVVVVKAVK